MKATDQTEQTAPADEPSTPDVTQTDAADESEPHSEAAKYRRRLRDTEAERDTLTGQVDGLRRQLVDNLTGSSLVDPADLWRHGTELADLLDEDGKIDAGKVTEAVAAVIAERPHLAAPRIPRPDPSQGARGTEMRGGDPWERAFKAS